MKPNQLAVVLLTLVVGLSSLADQRVRKRAPEDSISGGGNGPNAWTIHLLQTPGAPHLQVKHAPSGQIRIAWPATPAGFQVVQNTNRVKVVWTAPAEIIQEEGTNKFILVTPSPGLSYYQLEKKP